MTNQLIMAETSQEQYTSGSAATTTWNTLAPSSVSDFDDIPDFIDPAPRKSISSKSMVTPSITSPSGDHPKSLFQHSSKSLSPTQPTFDGVWIPSGSHKKQTIRHSSVQLEELPPITGKPATSLAEALNHSHSHNHNTNPSLTTISFHIPSTPSFQSPSIAVAPVNSSEDVPAASNSHPFKKLRSLPTRLGLTSDEITDQALHTQALLTHYRPSVLSYAPRIMHKQELMLKRHAGHLLAADQGLDGKQSKGKESVQLWRGSISPQFCEAGMFKNYLDEVFGPGDMLRGVGKQPMAQVASETDNSSDVEIVDDAHEDSTDGEAAKMEVMRRRRQIE
ncbi:hypothetical protein BDY19DRAFT_1045759 [Irpex rosettiformis]|uniref:Uncharacterized protein n=1 Tax=Irpex rosettiformis TaxID=378272 RepID=A0ACB8UE37_9APHY|nr:hypothetical protein BDY19DRAFT_1045759 [Irpex rosettiformis]